MQELLHKIKLIIEKFKSTKIYYMRGGVNPTRDWRILLFISFVVLCILTILAFYFYIQIKRGKLFVAMNDIIENDIKIDNVLLKKTIEDINARQVTSDNIKMGRMAIPSDPSI